MNMDCTTKTNHELLSILCGGLTPTLKRQSLSELFELCPPRQRCIASENVASYSAAYPQLAAAKELYGRALMQTMQEAGDALSTPNIVKNFCRTKIGHLPHEVFGVIFCDVMNRLIEFEQMFTGTLTQTSVYPREVVKRALQLNAAAVILTHNHPSGSLQPSRADENLTATLKAALALVDVRVLDHIVVSSCGAYSMAETGLM